jgi:GT2 family glycosyltransferase
MHDSLEWDTNETLPFVSVILPVYNDAVALCRCLHSLRKQTYPVDRFEVIVVDNGSTKDNPQAVVADFPGYRYCVETKVGSYAARNRGMSLANGEVYAFIDSDCIASEQWLEEGVRTLLTYPECGLVGGQVDIFVEDPEHPTSVELYERVYAFRFKQWIEELHVCGAGNMFVWPKVFDNIGLFNETFMSGGDFEWSGRVHQAGLKLIYNEKVILQHPARRTWREIIKRKRRIPGGSHYLKHSQNKSNHHSSLFRKISWLFVSPINLIRKYCSDSRLKSRSERFRVAIVFVVRHYVRVLESIRVRLGFSARRS